MEMLLRRRRETATVETGPVFQTLRERSPRDNSIKKNFNAAFEAVNLQWRGTHIARHTFATLALISERDIGAVQAALGHLCQKVTAGYAKIVALQNSKVTSNVAEMIGLRSERNRGENHGLILEGTN